MKTTQKTHVLFIIALIFSTLLSCQQKSKKSQNTVLSQSATVEELGQMNRDFAKALTAKDAEAAANLYDENASILPPNESIVTGRANIQTYWQEAINAGILDATVKTIDAKSNGNLGYEIGTYTLRFLGAQNDTIVEKGKYTEILKRNEEGKWISSYGMWSSNEPVPSE
ncbi:MAG TPA: DUF4440 domain-containing protein [Sunxiuqinia sp.]|nr:DUF4440 domain-containing protein [Sunxiuqinia sp.]